MEKMTIRSGAPFLLAGVAVFAYALIAEARSQLSAIRAANDAIAEPALSAQIDDIEATCRTILMRLEEQPQMLSSLRTFLRYYLPTAMKLLEARAKIEREVEAGASADFAARVRSAMEDVRTAFHKQLEALNEFRFISLESEMDALSAMLRSEGLTEQAGDGMPVQKEGEEDPFAGLFAQGGK